MLKVRREEKPNWRSQRPQVKIPQKQQQQQQQRNGETWMAMALKLSYFLPGMIIGFTLGLWTEFFPKNGAKNLFSGARSRSARSNAGASGSRSNAGAGSSSSSESSGELKMVFVVRMDLKMGGGKIASQCAHAAVGMYSDLMKSNRSLLNKWESYGQPKIVVTCRHEQEMDDLKAKAERAGLPTFTIADAGRTQVAAGSKTVLVIGPGPKPAVDSVTRQLRLL